MRRVYLDNDSYPELRDVQPRWQRSLLWWRAIRRAFGHGDFWRFVLVQLSVAIGAVVIAFVVARRPGLYALFPVAPAVALALIGYFQVSWGGDMMRAHLRAVSDSARYACPACGHSLVGHLDHVAGDIRCPECGVRVTRAVFEAPYRIPREFRAFPPWGVGPRTPDTA